MMKCPGVGSPTRAPHVFGAARPFDMIASTLTKNTTVCPHLYPLSLRRINAESTESIFVRHQPCVFSVTFDSVAGRPSEHEKVLISQRLSVPAIKNLHPDIYRMRKCSGLRHNHFAEQKQAR
jgi:hypothetical protein